MGPFDGGRPLAGPHFRRYRAECGEFVFRQRRDCPTRRKEKSRSRPRPAHHKISIPLPAFGTAQPPRPMGTGIPEPCASRAPASGRRSLGKRYTGETDIIRTLFKSLFLKRWPYFCVNHTVSRLQCQNTPRVGRVRRATATERRGRSVFIIAALSALCWAVLIGLVVLLVSKL